jgi:hypothetical protein
VVDRVVVFNNPRIAQRDPRSASSDSRIRAFLTVRPTLREMALTDSVKPSYDRFIRSALALVVGG